MDKELIFMLISIAVSVGGTFLLTCTVMRFLLPWLVSKKLNQPIGEYAPKTHRKKSETPTFGGISFVAATTVMLVLFSIAFAVFGEADRLMPLWLTLGLGLLNAAIGFIDDRSKLLKKQNEGLLAWQKYLLQLVAAAIYLVLMVRFGYFDTAMEIPFTDLTLDLGVFSYVIALVLITGIVNSTNLTDGVDGLLSSITVVVSLFFVAAAVVLNELNLALPSALLLGGVIGFLVYNAHPAKVFMGDTGSLFIGGVLCGIAFMMNEPLIILVVGGIYVIETASVILQIISARLVDLGIRKTRFFRRTPIHHHFELCDFTENQIVWLFSLVSVVFAVIAWFGIR